MQIDFKADEAYCGKKVYHILRGPLKISNNLITQLKKNGGILLNGRPARTVDKVQIGDVVSVNLDFREETFLEPEDRPLDIVFEDNSLLAVNKPPHMPVHPSAGHRTGTLAQAVLWHYQKQGLAVKIRPDNRLDSGTSGLTLFAKNAHIQDLLIGQMKENRIYKSYLGIVFGSFEPLSGTIRLPISRKEGSILERIVDPAGYPSVTHYSTIEILGDYSLVQFVLETGRTHQIRVHAKAAGHPLLGDWLYSDIPTHIIDRQALHAHRLSFDHPLTEEKIDLIAPIPDDIKRILYYNRKGFCH